MQYGNIHEAVFLDRPNRFVAHVELEGRTELVHVKNTGRCRELLIPGSRVYLVKSGNPERKTAYDLVAVEKERPDRKPLLVNIDSQAPNRVFREYAESGAFLPEINKVRPEYTWGNSRFDFYLEASGDRIMAEIKGCTLEQNGICMFPDAPTVRGARHVRELVLCRQAGMRAFLCIVVQMEEMQAFRPNDAMDPDFGRALREAAAAGVEIQALECRVSPDKLQITGRIPVIL